MTYAQLQVAAPDVIKRYRIHAFLAACGGDQISKSYWLKRAKEYAQEMKINAS